MNNNIKIIEESFKRDIPPVRIGDTVSVSMRIKEGDKERIQAFEGTLIARRGGGTRETITVRKISYGIGVEKIFPLHSPLISNIEVIKGAKARKAKLFYLRGKKGKEAKIKEKTLATPNLKAESSKEK